MADQKNRCHTQTYLDVQAGQWWPNPSTSMKTVYGVDIIGLNFKVKWSIIPHFLPILQMNRFQTKSHISDATIYVYCKNIK